MARLAILMAAAVAAGACTSDHRSDAFRCDTQSDCDGNRDCIEGFCVVPGGGPDANRGADANMSFPDAQSSCPGRCDSCSEDVCLFDCSEDDSCSGMLDCPSGWKCEMDCSGENSCSGGIECDELDCLVLCEGFNSCNGLVECTSGPCNVKCDGTQSCSDGVDCTGSCACDVDCDGTASCTGPIMCTRPQCISFDGGCRGSGGCDDC